MDSLTENKPINGSDYLDGNSKNSSYERDFVAIWLPVVLKRAEFQSCECIYRAYINLFACKYFEGNIAKKSNIGHREMKRRQRKSEVGLMTGTKVISPPMTIAVQSFVQSIFYHR